MAIVGLGWIPGSSLVEQPKIVSPQRRLSLLTTLSHQRTNSTHPAAASFSRGACYRIADLLLDPTSRLPDAVRLPLQRRPASQCPFSKETGRPFPSSPLFSSRPSRTLLITQPVSLTRVSDSHPARRAPYTLSTNRHARPTHIYPSNDIHLHERAKPAHRRRL